MKKLIKRIIKLNQERDSIFPIDPKEFMEELDVNNIDFSMIDMRIIDEELI